MALPEFSMRQLLEAGVHFGHQTHRWNPKMEQFIFGARNNIHIIDLAQTVPLLHQALVTIRDVVAGGGRVLFVGTKRQASDPIAEAAKRCAQYYINHRWLGGTLTNWKTISNSIRRLRTLEEMLGQTDLGLTKKELLRLTREKEKLDRALGGIKDMGGTPDLIFVIDTNKESIAIQEANKLGIPVVAILDSNCDPNGIACPIPGNDDAGRAISLYCDLLSRAVIDGISASQDALGIDIGESEEPAVEVLPEETPAAAEEAAAGTEDGAGEDGEEVERYRGLAEPDGEPDDLKKISGVGPVLEKKLNEMGIFHFRQIAEFSLEDIAKVDEELNFKGRIERDDWLEQARSLMSE